MYGVYVYGGWVKIGVREISFKRSLGCMFSGLEEMCVNCKGGVAELDTQFAHILCSYLVHISNAHIFITR